MKHHVVQQQLLGGTEQKKLAYLEVEVPQLLRH
jgi:hypothetical protein